MREPLLVLTAYLLGSFPTALIVSCLKAGVDIRQVGDGNMGARNVAHVLGWGPGILVAVTDSSKGGLAVLLATASGLSEGWRIATAAAAVLGHDFPVWAGFRGGQGMATIVGSLLVLAPPETIAGLVVFGAAYVITRSFDLSAAAGLGVLAYLVWNAGQSDLLTVYTIVLLLSIPAKKALDWPRRRRLAAEISGPEVTKEA